MLALTCSLFRDSSRSPPPLKFYSDLVEFRGLFLFEGPVLLNENVWVQFFI